MRFLLLACGIRAGETAASELEHVRFALAQHRRLQLEQVGAGLEVLADPVKAVRATNLRDAMLGPPHDVDHRIRGEPVTRFRPTTRAQWTAIHHSPFPRRRSMRLEASTSQWRTRSVRLRG